MRACPQCGTRFSEHVAFCPHDGSPTQEAQEAPPADPYLGRVVDGRYRVESVLGEGGMGIVYLISHAVLGKRMALKVLRGDMARDSEVVQRFVQEAQSATQIGHPNIVDISDFGKMPDGSAYFVMEYLDGRSLTDLVARGGSIPMQRAVHIVRQIASALEAAHERGIVHRDLKPDNIYVVKQGEDDSFVKVLDFGIAKVGGASSKLTKTGMIFGTPHYMSPEQAAGQGVDRRTDVYALGVIMYEMFAGRVPFDGDTFMGILSKHMFQEPVPPSQVLGASLGALEDVILRALAKKLDARYPSMSDLIADLDRVQSGAPVTRGGIAPPGNLADVLEPPSRTELRLGRATPEPEDTAATLPVASRMPLVIGAAALLGLFGAGAAAGAYVLATEPATTEPATTSPVAPATAAPPGTTTSPAVAGSPTAPSSAVAPPSGVIRAGEAAVVTVTIESVPPGAEVLLDGAIVGRTPLVVPRPTSGEREVVVRLRGYDESRVVMLPTSGSSVSVTLARGAPRSAPPRVAAGTDRAVRTDMATPAPIPPPPSRGESMTSMQTSSDVVDPWAM
jgi:serine/threonine-protein kinase